MLPVIVYLCCRMQNSRFGHLMMMIFLCFYCSASLDEGTSGASVLSGTVQTISLHSKSYFCFCPFSESEMVRI